VGADPTSIFSIAMMGAPYCASTAEPAHATAHATAATIKIDLIDRKTRSQLPSMRNLLDKSSAAQCLDGEAV
jgi:hypothetical protein